MRKSTKQEELRTKVLEAARALITEEGATALNVRKIMKRANYALGSFYTVFGSLDDLILTLNHETLTGLHLELKKTLEGVNEAKEVGRRIGECYIHFGKHNQPRWRLLFTIGTSPHYPIPTWYQNAVDQLFLDMEALLAPFLSPDPARKRLSLQTLWCGLHGICSLSFHDKLSVTRAEDPILLCEMLFSNFMLAERCVNFIHSAEKPMHSRAS